MTSKDFEVSLKEMDTRLSVVDNPDRPGLSNIFFEGKNYDLPVISTYDIRDEPDAAYQYEFPNGMRARFWSKGEILGRIESFLKTIDGNRELYNDK